VQRIILTLGLVLLGLLLGCDSITLDGEPFPVGSEADAVFDAGLVGSWHAPASGTDAASDLEIRSDDLRSYRLRLREAGSDEAVEMSGYVVDIVGAKYMNTRVDREPGVVVSGWVLLRYWFEAPNRLVIASVDSRALEGCEAPSAAALYDCLRRHAPDPRYFEDKTTYERVSLTSYDAR
jgi:hypothetical protein